GADLARHAGHLAGESVELVDHGIDHVLDLEDLSANVDGDLLCQVAAGDCGCDLGHVAQLHREIAGHQVHGIREVLPYTSHAFDLRLPAELSFRSDFARHAGDFAGEGI